MNKNEWFNLLDQAQRVLIENIDSPEVWTGRDVIYSPPRVERLTIIVQDFRIHLHKIYPANVDNSFFHYHPWECAFKILKGGYYQKIGYGDTSKDYPEYIFGEFYLGEGSMYIMDNPDSWHQVMPNIYPSYSIMVTRKIWQTNKEKLDNLIGKISNVSDLTIPISDTRKLELLLEFKELLIK